MKASRKAAQKKWNGKRENRNHFRGPLNVQRSREWRAANPGYWRKRRRVGPYVVGRELALVLRELVLVEAGSAQVALFIGLVAHMAKTLSHAPLARELRRLMALGNQVLTQKDGS